MKYLKITAVTGEQAKQFATAVSKELLKITRPHYDDDLILFPVIEHKDGGSYALGIVDTWKVRVHPDHDITNLLNLVSPYLTQQEIEEKVALLKDNINKDVVISDILPSSITLYTRDELAAEGWFNDDLMNL